VAFFTSPVTEAFITPKVARWARQRVGISHAQLADALGADAREIESWELGQTRPPFGKAQDLAKTLKVPFGFLFLSEPPPDKTPIADLRTVVEGRIAKLSPDFLELLNDVLVKHEWYREYLEEQDAERLPFVGKFRVTAGVERVSADLSSFLLIEQSRKASYTWDEFLRQLSRQAEAQGIMVMRSGIVRGNTRRKLSVNEFRGFVISDELAPLVFINGRDSKAAQIFTLVHELVHIWIDRSGISNPDVKELPGEQKNAIERFCNSAAAEVLVPREDFLKSLPAVLNDQAIQKLAARYRVSTVVILRRAYELGAITKITFFDLLEKEQQKQKEREEKEEEEPTKGGGNFYLTLPVRNSHRFTETVLSALQAQRVSYREAASLLGVRTGTLPKLIEGLPRR
jgi:Zn-dependent peptidase ImmA (M78 family)/transcriptional regulator with XRE-family HTH domain